MKVESVTVKLDKDDLISLRRILSALNDRIKDGDWGFTTEQDLYKKLMKLTEDIE